ncbi:hypothetical protein [Oceanithermus sp.]
MTRLSLLLAVAAVLLGGCLPSLSPAGPPATPTLVFPGGWISGGWVHQGDSVFSLPAPPLDADAAGGVLGVVYPYSWQRYRDGLLQAEATLPYRARRLHARPAWVVVLDRGLFTETGGWLDYPAQDAVNTDQGLFWVNDEGLWQNERLLVSEGFERVLAVGDRVLALGREHGRYWPGDEEIEVPQGWTRAAAAADLYLLTPEGLYRYDPAGYELGFYPGSFYDLAVGPDGQVWLAASDGGVVHLTPELEEAW